MSEGPDKDQKTEQPTAKKLADAKREGDVLQSRELGAAMVMGAGVLWFAIAGGAFMSASQQMVDSALRFDLYSLENPNYIERIADMSWGLLWPMSLLMGLGLTASIGASAMVGSLGFRTKAFMPKSSKMNPITGFKRIFGMQGLSELGKAIAKVFLLGWIAWVIFESALQIAGGLAATDLNSAITLMFDQLFRVMMYLTGGLLLIGGIDVLLQRTMRTKRLKMSKQEIKDEMRQTEGKPEIKQAQRRRAQQLLANSMRKAVTGATVIITNPTHFAVALRYQPGTDHAPIVVAKGADDVAAALRSLGDEMGITTLSYPALTRALYFTAPIGSAVAADLFMPVATLLAFVFNMDRALAEGRGVPHIEIPEQFRYDASGRREGGL